MKSWKKRAISVTAAITLMLTASTGISFAAAQSAAPSESSVIITNNTRARDTIYISGLEGGDIVKIYSAATGTKLLVSGKVLAYSDEITLSVSQLGVTAGSIYVTVTSLDEDESERVKVDFEEESTTPEPVAEYVSVENNAGMSDSVFVTGLTAGDVVKVYSSAKSGKLLGSATMSSSRTEAEVKIGQLGTGSGSIFISVTAVGQRESNRVEVPFTGEPKSDDPFADSIMTVNNAGMYDSVTVTNLSAGDVVKVYNALSGGKLMGTASVPNNKVETTVSVSQLGTKAGSVYVSITSKGKSESNRIKVDFLAEEATIPVISDYISIINNSLGTSDTIDVLGVSGNDVVKVYTAAVGGKLIGSASASSNDYRVTVNIPQIGASAGTLYISVTSKGLAESSRVPVSYGAEPRSFAPTIDNITVSNNAGTPDTIAVACISSNDVVKVYDAVKGGRLLGTATVPANQSGVTVSIPQIGTTAGVLYVSVTSTKQNESDRTAVSYIAESTSTIVASANTAITNNPAGTADLIVVSNISAGDIVKVYDAVKGGNLLGTATAASGRTDATISVPQLGTGSGYVYIALMARNKLESGRTAVSYAAEASSGAPSVDNIFITNNAGAADTIEVTGLAAGDVVTVYDSAIGGSVLATGTVQTGKSSVSMTVSQLGDSAGSVYVSTASKGKNASGRVKADYTSEEKSGDPKGDSIVITNNAGASDTVEVIGINAGDIVNVYNAAKGGKLLGTATVASGKTSAVVTITQLGSTSDTAYISITSANKQESTRIAVIYTAEAVTNAPAVENITLTNNPAGTPDTADIIGLVAGDIVNVYDAAKGGSLLGTATVQTGKSAATVSIPQLGIAKGKAYVSVTSAKRQESNRTEAAFEAEPKTNAPDGTQIVVVNNPAGTNDTVYVPGISTGDIVNIYDSQSVGKLLGTATASGSDSGLTVTIAQLGRYAGSVYVTLTGRNKLESDRVKVEYAEESKTNKLLAANISVDNNAGVTDTVSVSGVLAGDIIKVYDAASGGTMIGQVTVANGSTAGTVGSLQLGTLAGKIYVTLTNKNKLESDRTEVSFDAEAKTDAPDAAKIFVTNNAGADDIVKVTGLSSGYTVKVYDTAVGGTVLGTGTVATYKSEVYISINQIGNGKGRLYVTATGNKNQLESDRTEVEYTAEPVSGTPAVENITIVNNAGMNDTIRVIGLSAGDVINIYDLAQGGNLLGTATVASAKTEATVSVEQLGTNLGKVYVSLTSKNKLESGRTEAMYSAESKSTEPKDTNISVVNNAGMPASITVTGLLGNDVVSVYDSATKANLIGTGTVQQYYTEVTFDISQLGSEPGYVYVTVTNKGKLESAVTKASYGSKPQTAAPEAQYVTVANNAGTADTVTVTNLKAGDIVKVYSDADKNDVLGSGTVSNGNSELTISITQVGTAGGKIYVTVTNMGKLESTRTPVSFSAEKTSTAPTAGNITVTNAAGMSGTVKVTGLVVNDTVKVYDAPEGGNLLGTATLGTTSSQVVVSIPSLGNSGGYVYVSVKSTGKAESGRTAVSYTSVSDGPMESNVTIVNNVNINDTITITNLTVNDLVKVYDSAQGGTLLGKAQASGTTAIVSIPQLTDVSGTVYITITSFGKSESVRTPVDYGAEQNSTAPYQGNITIVNNVGISDTVTVGGLSPNDVAVVYDMSSGGSMLGYSIVPSGSTQVTIKISQLGTTAGTVYVAVVSLGKYESSRTAVQYIAEQSSATP